MDVYYTKQFAREYKKIPEPIQVIAEKREKIFRENPFDPRLKTHRLRGPLKDSYAFSVDQKYRVIFQFGDNHQTFFISIGDHNIYD